MNNSQKDRASFIFLAAVSLLSVCLIIANALLKLHIPFSVNFLIGFVGALLVFVVWHLVLTKGWRRSLGMFLLSFLVAFTAE